MKQRLTSDVPTASMQRGVMYTGSGLAVMIAALFAETMIAVRALTPESYGSYALLVVVVNMLVVLVDFGCKTAVTQLIASSDHDRQRAVVRSALLFRIAVLATTTTAIWLGGGILGRLGVPQVIVQYIGYVPVLLAVASVDELLLAMLQGFQSYSRIAVAQTIRSVLRLCLTATFLVLLDLGVAALLYSWTLSFAASSLYMYLLLPGARRPGTPRRAGFVAERRLLGELLRFGMPLQASRLLWAFFRQVDVLLLGLIAGPASTAYYAVASRIPDALHRLAESFTAVYFPTVASLWSQRKLGAISEILNRSLRLISFVSALMALGAVVFGAEIVELLFSATYAPSSVAFALLMLAFHVTLLLNVLGYTLTAVGQPGRSLVENVARTGLNIAGDLVLIPVLGFLGPPAALLISVYTVSPFAVWLLRRSNVPLEVAACVRQTLLLLLCALGYWWFTPSDLAVRGGVVALFVALNLLLGTVARDDLTLLLPDRFFRRTADVEESISHGV